MRRLNTVFGTTPELKALAARAEKVIALQKVWEEIAPPPLNKHSHVGLLNDGELKVYTRSSAVASKLKMQLTGLVRKLQKQGVEVTSIRVEVQVTTEPRVPVGAPLRVSREAAKSLLRLADALPEPALKKSLRRLAGRA